MLLRPAAAIALLALALASSAGPGQDRARSIALARTAAPALELTPRALELARAAAATLGGKRSFALTERLDEVIRSHEFELVLRDVFAQFNALSYAEVRQATNDYDVEDLFGKLADPGLRPLAHRIFAALTATYQLMSERMVATATRELAEQPKLLALGTEDLSVPVAIRRCLRHSARGFVALLCLPFVEGDFESRSALFDHAAIGVEANLRLIAAVAEDQRIANATLRSLRLEPLDLEALWQRQAQLDEARGLIDEIKRDIPGFRLPPDPGFTEA
jgi:hypothetical protein